MVTGKRRWDGQEIKLSPYQKVEAHFIQDRIESTIYMTIDCDLSKTISYAREQNISLFAYFIYVLTKISNKHPELNRFVMNNRLYQRNHFAISTVVKQSLTKEGKSITVKWIIDKDSSLDQVNKLVFASVRRAKSNTDGSDSDKLVQIIGSLPHFVIRSIMRLAHFLNRMNWLPSFIAKDDPLHASVMVANLGSIDLIAPLHHLYNWGTISIFVVMGKVDDKNMTCKFTVSVDERITDGFALSRAFLDFKHWIENPE